MSRPNPPGRGQSLVCSKSCVSVVHGFHTAFCPQSQPVDARFPTGSPPPRNLSRRTAFPRLTQQAMERPAMKGILAWVIGIPIPIIIILYLMDVF